MDCLALFYIGWTSGICILFVVTCLVVNKIFNYENDVDIDDIKESSSYKTIYENEITPSNNFLLVSPSETPFKNPFYMLVLNKKKGYLYEHDSNYKPSPRNEAFRLNNTDEKSFRFAHNVENLDRSNKAVPTNKDKSVNNSVNKENKRATNDKNKLTRRKANIEDDDSNECICKTCDKSEKGKCNNDVKYIYRGKNVIANDIGTSGKKSRKNVETVNDSKTDTCINTLDACCSAMTFKQIETIMQTDAIAIIDRKTYRNCSTCMSKHNVGKTNVYASTSTPRCLARCSQVDSEVFGTRKAFKNRCTSVIQVQRVEQWIQTEPVVSRKKIESHKKYISAGAVHVNSNEKCEICHLKRIMERIDKQIEKDKSMASDRGTSSKIYAQNRVQFSVTRKKPAKITEQVIESNPKKTAAMGSSTIVSSTVKYSTNTNSSYENSDRQGMLHVPKVLVKSTTNDRNFKQSNISGPTACISTCPNKNVLTESTFDKKHKNMLQKLSQQAQSYLENARKITRQMKEYNPTIEHYRIVKKDILNDLPLSRHTSKIEINAVYDRNSSEYHSKYELETLGRKESQTEVTIKNLIPVMDITIKSPHKNLKSSRIRVETKQTSNNNNEDISSKSMDAKVYCQPCTKQTKQISYSNTEDIYSKNMAGKVYCQPCTSAKSSIKRAAVINSKSKISLNRNKLQINHSSSMIAVSNSSSEKCLGAKCAGMTFRDDRQIQKVANVERKKVKLAQTNNIPQTTVKYSKALQPRYNIKPSPSKNIAPWYFRETVSRTNYLKTPTNNVTQTLPRQDEQMCAKIYCKKPGLIGNCCQVNSAGIDKDCTCCPLQSSSIRSSQIYPRCLQKKPIQSTCFNCNLGLASGRLCRCIKKYPDYPKWR